MAATADKRNTGEKSASIFHFDGRIATGPGNCARIALAFSERMELSDISITALAAHITLKPVRYLLAPLPNIFPILNLAAGDINHEFGELSGVAGKFGRFSGMTRVCR